MNKKKPMIKETVGSLYLAFNTPDDDGEFDGSNYEETITSDVVDNIKTTENAESTTVRGSGKDYTTVNLEQSIDMAIEVIAFDPTILARMRADIVDESGLNFAGRSSERPYFAFGKVVKKYGGGLEYAWYPKCQLIENTDDIATSGESFSQQNDTVTIRAYEFNDVGDKKSYVNNEMSTFPTGLTEDMFFATPILTVDDLTSALVTESTTEETTDDEA